MLYFLKTLELIAYRVPSEEVRGDNRCLEVEVLFTPTLQQLLLLPRLAGSAGKRELTCKTEIKYLVACHSFQSISESDAIRPLLWVDGN